MKDSKDKRRLLIDMSIPANRNIGLKEFEKLSKYKYMGVESGSAANENKNDPRHFWSNLPIQKKVG